MFYFFFLVFLRLFLMYFGLFFENVLVFHAHLYLLSWIYVCLPMLMFYSDRNVLMHVLINFWRAARILIDCFSIRRSILIFESTSFYIINRFWIFKSLTHQIIKSCKIQLQYCSAYFYESFYFGSVHINNF